MKRKIFLGGKHQKGSSVIDMELYETENGWCFTASGLYDYQYNRSFREWDYHGGGQCLDRIAEDHPKNEELQIIVKLWKKYHLNDLNAGTPKQTEYLKSLGEYKNYDWACKELKKVDLLYDKEYNYPNQSKGYQYGSAWLHHEIPTDDLELIKQLIKTN